MRDRILGRKGVHALLLAIAAGTALYFATGAASPQAGDDSTYYYIAQSNVLYLRQWLSPEPMDRFYDRFREAHIVPCAMPVAKPFTFLVHTLFAAIAGPDYQRTARGNLLLGLAFVAAMTAAAAQLGRMGWLPQTSDRRSLSAVCVTPVAAAASGLILHYARSLSPPMVTQAAVGVALAAYLWHLANPAPRRALGAGACASIATAAHLSTAPFVGALVAVEAVRLWRGGGHRRRSTAAELLVFVLALPLAHLVFQVLTWLPQLWIADPNAWHFTAWYGRPYMSHFEQLRWYFEVVATGRFDEGGYLRRFTLAFVVPGLVQGPILVLAGAGLARTVHALRRTDSPVAILLLIGPFMPTLAYTLYKPSFVSPYAMAPLSVYFTLLAVVGAVWLSAVAGGHRRRSVRVWAWGVLLGTCLLQVWHVRPVLLHRGGLLQAGEFLAARGEDEALDLSCKAEAMGLSVWSLLPSASDPSTLSSKGMRPELEWEDEPFPRYLLLSYRQYVSGAMRELLGTRGVDLGHPVRQYGRLKDKYTQPARYLGLASRLLAVCCPPLAAKLEPAARFMAKREYDNGYFVYALGPYRDPGYPERKGADNR